ncbi:MAG TPA: sugar ABC transporter permease [Gaiellaceae bacterium]|jgi:multiple sugar transport system permease protein|nr:sugar ABC transporter permease [Gaiellaceae bacterium]
MASRQTVRGRQQGAGLDRFLPYLLLAPAVLLVVAVVVYPLISGIQESTRFYRYGRVLSNVGFSQYRQAWNDPLFTGAVWTTIKFVTAAVAVETLIGLGLALLCVHELRFIRAMRVVLIVPMVVTPVVVGIVFRLIYASDVGLLSSTSHLVGGGSIGILDSESRAFWGLVALDVWEWTPLIFLILLAGLQSLPSEPFEAARVDGAGVWRTFRDHTLPMLMPVLAVAIVLRTIDAFTTFDQVYVLTHGGPGTSTELISLYGYDTFFKFQQFGYAAAMLLMVALVILAFAFLAVRLMRRQATA